MQQKRETTTAIEPADTYSIKRYSRHRAAVRPSQRLVRARPLEEPVGLGQHLLGALDDGVGRRGALQPLGGRERPHGAVRRRHAALRAVVGRETALGSVVR